MTLVSGGDDQAVHVAVFQLQACLNGKAPQTLSGPLQLTMLCSRQVVSAHTSAIRVGSNHAWWMT